MEKIILLGSGGHAKSVVDTIERIGTYEIAGFLEIKEKQDFSYKSYKVIGTDDDMERFYEKGIRSAFVTIGYMGMPTPREKLYKRLKNKGFMLPSLVDPTAIIAKDAILEEGIFVGKNAIVNADACVGKMSIINTNAVVEHECIVGAYSHIAIGAVLCGRCRIGRECFIGANATIIQNVVIEDQAVVGAGSVVLHSVAMSQKVVGRPAKEIDK